MIWRKKISKGAPQYFLYFSNKIAGKRLDFQK
jgi:hypothetical protein